MDWDKLKTFHAAAEAGSLTGAAGMLDLSQSAVSRQIAALERELGASLFHRHPRGLQPTEQGRLLHEATRDMHARVSLAAAALQDARESPSGVLHVTAPLSLGSAWLVPRLQRFAAAYPDIRLELILDDTEMDLSTFEVECALRLWRPTQADLIQRRLMKVRQSLYAAPDYLARRHAPQKITDLDEHPIITYGAKGSNPMADVDWPLTIARGDAGPRAPFLTVNTLFGVMRAIEGGLGIGSLPEYLAADSERLTQVLPGEHGPDFEVYFVYPEELRGSRRIAAFSDFLYREARATQGA